MNVKINVSEYPSDLSLVPAYRIAVMQAAEAGAPVQCRHHYDFDVWCDTSCPSWDWGSYRYRIAPSPEAEGHNPDKLTENQVGVKDGWRLLTSDEIDPTRVVPHGDIEKMGYLGDWSARGNHGNRVEDTYRTRKPAGYFLPKPTNRERAEKLVRESELPEEYKTLILERIDESPGAIAVQSLSHLLLYGLIWCDTPEGICFWRDLWDYVCPSSGPSVLPLIPGSPVDLRVKAIKEPLQKLPEPYRSQALGQADPSNPMTAKPAPKNKGVAASTQDVRGSGLSVASGSPPGLFNLYVRRTDGRMKKLTGYAMTHHECCVMKSKLSEWSQARTLLVKETK